MSTPPAEPPAERPAAEDLTSKETPADLHKFEVKGLWGIGEVKLWTSNKLVGIALAWLVLVCVAIGAGYAVYRLATSLAMSPTVTLVLVLITSGIILLTGGYFVTNLTKSEK